MARWRPRVFDHPVTLFAATESDFGCDLADLWEPWLPRLEVRQVLGSHLDLTQTASGAARLAHSVTGSLAAPPSRLKVLVACTFRWPGAARLAADLHEVGCTVEGVAPRGSALHVISAVQRSHRLSLTDPLGSLRAAIEASDADIVVPFDDRTRYALALLQARSDPRTRSGARMRERLERSLGSPDKVTWVYSRAAVLAMARDSGVLCPLTEVVRSAGDISAWFERHPGPAVLKTDGSWGGRGVAILRGESDGRKAWREMRRRPPLARALKRLVVARDPWDLRALMAGTRPTFSIQSYVAGRPANAAVACFRGTTLAAVQAEVIESAGKTGPSTVLRLIENPDMAYAVKSVVNNLELSGLCGLDFILDDGGRAHLIELEPARDADLAPGHSGRDGPAHGPAGGARGRSGARTVSVVPERSGGAVSPGTASRPGQPEPPARPPRRTVARAGPRRPCDGRSARTATDGATFGRGSRAGGRYRLMRQQLKQETGKEAVKRNGMDRGPGASSGSRWVVNVNVHGVGPLPSRPLEDGEDQVWISVEQLEGLLDAAVGRPDVTITFDDGNLSDLELGLPRLQERGSEGAVLRVRRAAR